MKLKSIAFILAFIWCFFIFNITYPFCASKKSSRGNFLLHRVKKGETLLLIARKYHVFWLRIARFNHIKNPYIIKANSIIKIPLPPKGSYHIYRVRKGDTLIKIARLYRVSFKEIARENGISPPYKIYKGERLRIPLKGRKIKIVSTKRKTKKKACKIKISFFSPLKSVRSKAKGINGGWDLRLKKGEFIYPSASGEVAFCSLNMRGFSSVLILEHPGGYETIYAGNGIYWQVGEGEKVKKETILGEALDDTTLHFEIRKMGEPIPVDKVIRK